jgi:extracellular elastinolytic metalloproteinase
MLKPQEFQGSGDQVVLGSEHVISDELSHIHNTHCGSEVPCVSSEDPTDFRPALLKFMATATPDSKLAADIANDSEKYLSKITVEPTSHFAPSGSEAAVEFVAGNVPDAINPVKARLAYNQVLNAKGDSTDLHLVWKVRNFDFSRSQ